MTTRRNGNQTGGQAPIDPNVDIGRTLADFLQNLQNGNRNGRVAEQFRQYHPPTFNGRDGPAAVEEWFRSIERIFRILECDDAQKISCATYQLVEDAGHWWEGVLRNQTEAERNGFTWDNFKTTIMDKYFPQSYADQKEGEFLHLKQRSMNVTDYERKFNELSRFAPHLVDTDARRASRFKRGLRPELAGILAAQGGLAYAELVRRAEDVEVSLERPEGGSSKEKRRWNGDNHNYNNNYKQARLEESNKSIMGNERVQCKECGKYHSGECLKGQNKCFRCHQTGHKIENCPRNRQTSGAPQGQGRDNEQRRGGNARMYVMTCNDNEGNTNTG